MNQRGHRRPRVGLIYEDDAPKVACQHPRCGYQLRRDKPGNIVHVDEVGRYIYIDHRPVLPQPKEQ